MKRVAIVNLGGQAFHVEEDGVDELQRWLNAARSTLHADPDVDEIMSDFERAIADRFAGQAPDARDVVTAVTVADALAALGPVDPGEDARSEEDGAPDSQRTAASPPPGGPSEGGSWRDRKLYRLPDEQNAITGVCAGIAAYFGVDVTVVRVLTVLLTVLTGGGLIIGYVVLALVVPEATSGSERAAAKGYGDTAQELIRQVRDNAGPAFSSLGQALGRAFRGLGQVIKWIGISLTWIVLAVWMMAFILVFTYPSSWRSAFDPGTSIWWVALFVTCVLWLALAVAIGLVKIGASAARSGHQAPRSGPKAAALSIAWSGATIAALVGAVAIPITQSADLRGLHDGQGRITFGSTTLCFERPDDVIAEDSSARLTASEICQPGDERIDVD